MAFIDCPGVGTGASGHASYLHFLDDPPLPVCILLAALIADQSIPARLDQRGCEMAEPRALSELCNLEDAAVIEGWLKSRLGPDQICDECGLRMGEDIPLEDLAQLESQHIFSLTNSGVKSFFVCTFCQENWGSYCDDAGLPNVMGKLTMLDIDGLQRGLATC